MFFLTQCPSIVATTSSPTQIFPLIWLTEQAPPKKGCIGQRNTPLVLTCMSSTAHRHQAVGSYLEFELQLRGTLCLLTLDGHLPAQLQCHGAVQDPCRENKVLLSAWNHHSTRYYPILKHPCTMHWLERKSNIRFSENLAITALIPLVRVYV